MNKKYKSSIYLFNRDLRWQDNECLANAISDSDIVYPIFILTPEQVDKNQYANYRSVSFMCSSILELANEIPVCIFKGATNSVLQNLCVHNKSISAIYNNLDVTPYAEKRSNKIRDLCKKRGIDFIQGHDIFFGRHCNLLKKNGDPYMIYTPFYQNAYRAILKEQPAEMPRTNLNILKKINTSQQVELLKKYICKDESAGTFIPGRKAAIIAINKFCSQKSNYAIERDIPHKNSTSHLSAYLHFGIVGPVETAHLLREKYSQWRNLIKQLVWREFYLYIIWHIHKDYKKKSHSILKNNNIIWAKSEKKYRLWCVGNTGCPWIDAGMRELNSTGFMQNRLRMNVAMFLIFYLQADWKLGEKYFAKNLYDYDYCQNVCNWMWCASWEQFSNPIFLHILHLDQIWPFD